MKLMDGLMDRWVQRRRSMCKLNTIVVWVSVVDVIFGVMMFLGMMFLGMMFLGMFLDMLEELKKEVAHVKEEVAKKKIEEEIRK